MASTAVTHKDLLQRNVHPGAGMYYGIYCPDTDEDWFVGWTTDYGVVSRYMRQPGRLSAKEWAQFDQDGSVVIAGLEYYVNAGN